MTRYGRNFEVTQVVNPANNPLGRTLHSFVANAWQAF